MSINEQSVATVKVAPTYEIPHKEMAKYAVGDGALSLATSLISVYLIMFLTDTLFVDPLIVGSTLAIIKIYDAIKDPVAGMLVDNHVFKNGEKFRPIFNYTALPMGLLIVLMFSGLGSNVSPTLAFAIAMVGYFIFITLQSFQDCARSGIASNCATTSAERSRLHSIKGVVNQIFASVPQVIGICLGLNAIKTNNTAQRLVFFMYALVFGLGGLLMLWWGNRAAQERCLPRKGKLKNPFEPMKHVLKNRNVLLFNASLLLYNTTFLIYGTYLFRYYTFDFFGLKIPGMTFNMIFDLLTILPATAGMLFTKKLANKLGGYKNLLLLFPIVTIALNLITFAVAPKFVPSAWPMLFLVLTRMIIAIPAKMKNIAGTVLVTESLDQIEYKTGKRNEGSLYAVNGLLSKASGAVMTFFIGLTLSFLQWDAKDIQEKIKLNDNIAYAGAFPDAFNKYAWLIFVLGPVVGATLSIVPILFIKYNKKEQEAIEEALKVRRAEAKAKEEAIASAVVATEDATTVADEGTTTPKTPAE